MYTEKIMKDEKEKKVKEVFSTRINPDITKNFKEICEKLGVKEGYVIQELLKDFIVRNLSKEAYETAEIVTPRHPENSEI